MRADEVGRCYRLKLTVFMYLLPLCIAYVHFTFRAVLRALEVFRAMISITLLTKKCFLHVNLPCDVIPSHKKKEQMSMFKIHKRFLRTNTEKVFWVFIYYDLFSKQTRKILFKVTEVVSVIYNNHKKKTEKNTFLLSLRPHKNHGKKNGCVIHCCFFSRNISRNTQRISEGLKEVII